MAAGRIVTDDQAAAGRARAAAALELDPDRSNIVVAIGHKGSGKSEAARQIFDAWPYDRLVIDVTGDARPDDPDTITVTAGQLGTSLPEPPEGKRRVTVWARLDPRRPSFVDDQDDALGLGLHPRSRNTLVWVDEYAMMATPARIGPNLRLALMSSRHYRLSMLLAFPRPRSVPVLTLAQADRVFIFRTPHRADRELIAQNIGYPVPAFERYYAETMARDKHAFLLWDSNQHVLIGCPPLPIPRRHGPKA